GARESDRTGWGQTRPVQDAQLRAAEAPRIRPELRRVLGGGGARPGRAQSGAGRSRLSRRGARRPASSGAPGVPGPRRGAPRRRRSVGSGARALRADLLSAPAPRPRRRAVPGRTPGLDRLKRSGRRAGGRVYGFGGFQNWSTSLTTSSTVFWSLPPTLSTRRL